MSLKCHITIQMKEKGLGLAKHKNQYYINGSLSPHTRTCKCNRKQKCNREEGTVVVFPRINKLPS